MRARIRFASCSSGNSARLGERTVSQTLPMKLVVFAHVPPPHHGQSQMVQLLLEGLGGDARRRGTLESRTVECYHVDCRLSHDLEEIGQARLTKLLPLLGHCLEAIYLRVRYGADHFYFIPATACRLGMLRDWIVLAFCRLFFRKVIFHWEAAGLGVWLQTQARPWERLVSRRLIFRPELSVVLGEFNRSDAEAIQSRHVAVVPNGLPDPCPEFERDVRPKRLVRARSRLEGSRSRPPRHLFRVLFMSLCCREKGLFDAVEAVALANRKLSEGGSSVRMQLTVAGTFWREEEKAEFEERIGRPDLAIEMAQVSGADGHRLSQRAIRYAGFVQGVEKQQLLEESDCFCFPSYYPAESFGLALIEAMAFGLPVIATRWRNIPELLPEDYVGLVAPRDPEAIANSLLTVELSPPDFCLRERFLKFYTVKQFVAKFVAALATIDRR